MSLFKDLKNAKGLTAREAEIRDFILAHPEKLAELSSRELGAATYSSAATITRFSKKLGYKGYPDFKLRFTSELVAGKAAEDVREDLHLAPRENLLTIYEKINTLSMSALQATQEAVSVPQLIRIERLLLKSDYVDLYAYDNNLALARYACNLFAYAGKTAYVYCDSNEQVLHALATPPGHVAILLSHTGESRRIIELAEILGERRVQRIVITPSRDSALGRLADEYLFAPSSEGSTSMWMSLYASGVKYLCDLLFAVMFISCYRENAHLNKIYEEYGLDTFWNLTSKPRDPDSPKGT